MGLLKPMEDPFEKRWAFWALHAQKGCHAFKRAHVVFGRGAKNMLPPFGHGWHGLDYLPPPHDRLCMQTFKMK